MPVPQANAMPGERKQVTETWASALLLALARDEAAGRRPPRLTEPRLATWTRFRGRLTDADFVLLLFEDAAVVHPVPFDPASMGDSIDVDRYSESVAKGQLHAIRSLEPLSPAEYVVEQARRLGLPTRLGRSDLHVIRPHHRVLELPGTGGQLAHHVVSSQRQLVIQDGFTIACASWRELTLAGVVALDLGAPHSEFIVGVEAGDLGDPRHALRQRSFDYVLGLDPEKGGAYRIQEELAIWFPTAKILLV